MTTPVRLSEEEIERISEQGMLILASERDDSSDQLFARLLNQARDCAKAERERDDAQAERNIFQNNMIEFVTKLKAAEARVKALESALQEIIKDAPTEDPNEDISWHYGNEDDAREDGRKQQHWHLAQISRAAISKGPKP